MYTLNPISVLPVASWKKKSMFQSASKNTTEMASMLTSSAFSSHSAGTSASKAISENQRKISRPVLSPIDRRQRTNEKRIDNFQAERNHRSILIKKAGIEELDLPQRSQSPD